MDILPKTPLRGELAADTGACLKSPSEDASAFGKGEEFLGQCPELLAAEVSGALATLRGLDSFVENWVRNRAAELDSADIARLARTVIASARARGEVAANLLKALPSYPKKARKAPSVEA